jgi:hypothetical protein
MPYIPKNHEKYNLLPYCKKDGGEVFDYPSELIYEAEQLLGSSEGLYPYNYDSYNDYFSSIDDLIKENSNNFEIVSKLTQIREMVQKMNQKEEWSILRYIGPSDDGPCGLTKGKIYYWPTRKEHPVYRGVIDDEEFTAYLYPTEESLWEIIEDPTGMAHKTIYEHGEGYISQTEHDNFIEQIRKEIEVAKEKNL